MHGTFPKTHNGGPALDNAAPSIMLGEKFLDLFKPARHKAYYGGRGSAKSHSIAAVLVLLSAHKPLFIVCARQFQNSIRDSVKQLIESKIRVFGLISQFTILEREIVHNGTGSRFVFVGLDRNPDSIKSLEGADICWVEEARTINQRSMEILIPTVRKPGSEIWWSWNPENEDDPVDDYFRGNGKQNKHNKNFLPPPNSIIKRVGIEDNPWFYQTEMPNEMWFMLNGNHRRYLHIWMGEYDTDFESKIFPNVIIGRIEIPDYVPPRYGMDFGFGSDPSVILKLYVDNLSRRIYIAKEFMGRIPLRDLPLAMDTVVESRDDLIKADSSQPGSIDHLNSCGFNLFGAKKGPGSIKAGISWLQSYQIYIDPECEYMQEEARLYSWQVDKLTGKRLSVPVDAHNHGWDAVRYATEDAQVEPDTRDENEGGMVLRL
jgi:phage terminase large subunit